MAAPVNYTDERKGLWFSIDIEQEEFVAFISAEALSIHFKGVNEKSSHLSVYRENRKIIDSVARQKFIDGFPRPIKLDTVDF